MCLPCKCRFKMSITVLNPFFYIWYLASKYVLAPRLAFFHCTLNHSSMWLKYLCKVLISTSTLCFHQGSFSPSAFVSLFYSINSATKIEAGLIQSLASVRFLAECISESHQHTRLRVSHCNGWNSSSNSPVFSHFFVNHYILESCSVVSLFLNHTLP